MINTHDHESLDSKDEIVYINDFVIPDNNKRWWDISPYYISLYEAKRQEEKDLRESKGEKLENNSQNRRITLVERSGKEIQYLHHYLNAHIALHRLNEGQIESHEFFQGSQTPDLIAALHELPSTDKKEIEETFLEYINNPLNNFFHINPIMAIDNDFKYATYYRTQEESIIKKYQEENSEQTIALESLIYPRSFDHYFQSLERLTNARNVVSLAELDPKSPDFYPICLARYMQKFSSLADLIKASKVDNVSIKNALQIVIDQASNKFTTDLEKNNIALDEDYNPDENIGVKYETTLEQKQFLRNYYDQMKATIENI